MEISRIQFTALVEHVNDLVAAGKNPSPDQVEKITAAITAHPEWVAPPPPPAAPPQAAIVNNKGERPQIVVTENIDEVAHKVLLWLGTRFCVFQSGGRLLEIRTDPVKELKFITQEAESPHTVPVGSARARALTARECNLVKEKISKDGKKEDVSILPPDWLGPTIVTRTDFPGIPILSALAQAPTLRSDGALIHEPGYDVSTGIYLTEDLSLSIPENPTFEDARKSTAVLLDLLCDFEFTNPAARSVWLASLLSVTCRHTFTGPTPLFIFDASKRGAGKTRLADMVSYTATGRSAPRMVYVRNDIEMDKRITSLGLAGDQLVLIDNIVGKLASQSLDMALTSETYRGRVLQKSEMTPAMPMKMVWFATGNGMIVGADTARRALLTRIEPSVEHPEYRSGPRPGVKWKYDLPGHCLRNRAELLGHCLTIVAAYIRANRPEVALKNGEASLEMGSYEGWSRTIRAAIVWVGELDPCLTIKDVHDADLEAQAVQTMVECWPLTDGVEVTASTLLEWAEMVAPMTANEATRARFEQTRQIRELWRNALLNWLPAKTGNLPTARELGYALRSVRGAIVGNFKIEAGKPLNSGIPWQRKCIDPAKEKQSSINPASLSAVK